MTIATPSTTLATTASAPAIPTAAAPAAAPKAPSAPATPKPTLAVKPKDIFDGDGGDIFGDGGGGDDGGSAADGPHANLYRQVYDAQNTEPSGEDGDYGQLVRSEGDPAADDPVVNKAYDNAGVVYNFYKTNFGRNSIDGKGMPIISTVHYGQNYNNAFWDGTHMSYGDGDGEHFRNFVDDLSVVGHEMTHGVTQNTAQLNYEGQAGALNESWSDVMGQAIRQWHNQTPQQYASVAGAKAADWKIGDNIFTPGTPGDALRSLAHPGQAYPGDPQPATMADYKSMPDDQRHDNGGVHINSGIPNHAAYLVAQQIGTKDEADIWYRTLTHYLKPNSQFIDAANDTVRSADDLFGKSSRQVQAVKDAWTAVGLTPTMHNTRDEDKVIQPVGGDADDGIVPPYLHGKMSALVGTKMITPASKIAA